MMVDLVDIKTKHEADQQFTQFKYMMAHDVNYQWQMDALHLVTNVPSWMQGTSSIFMAGIVLELHYTSSNGYTVQAWSQASSMSQIRNLNGMHRAQLALPLCSKSFDCPLPEFLYRLGTFIDISCIDPSFRKNVTNFIVEEVDRISGRKCDESAPSLSDSQPVLLPVTLMYLGTLAWIIH